ncbi:hypothetical protein COOONC_22417 [Cooperia oncophora]
MCYHATIQNDIKRIGARCFEDPIVSHKLTYSVVDPPHHQFTLLRARDSAGGSLEVSRSLSKGKNRTKMGRGEHLQRKIQAANESAEAFRVVLRITIALLVFTLVFTLLMFLHYKRAIGIWPSLHPYHKAVLTTTVAVTAPPPPPPPPPPPAGDLGGDEYGNGHGDEYGNGNGGEE